MFNSNYILLLVPLVFLFCSFKKRNNKMYWSMTLFYSIGGLFAFLLTQQDFFYESVNSGHQNVSFSATIYYICCMSLLFEPIRRERSGYVYCGKVSSNNLKNFCLLFIIISVMYTVAIIPYVNGAFNAIDAVAYHDEMLEQGGVDVAHGNPILVKVFAFQEMLRPVFTFLTCYILCDNRFNSKFKITLCACCVIPTILDSMASSSRNAMVFFFLDFLLCFMLFHHRYTEKIKRIVLLMCSVLGAIMVAIVIVFAIARFSDSIEGDIASYSLYRYAGEPLVNFNTMLWDNGHLLYGNKSFTTIRSLLGLNIVDPSMQRQYYSGLPYVIYCFYSIVGNFYMDFGFWGGVILCGLIGLMFYLFITHIIRKNTITRLLVIFLYVSFTIKNYFYFSFMGSNNIQFVWYCIFVLIIYKTIDRGSYKQQK